MYRSVSNLMSRVARSVSRNRTVSISQASGGRRTATARTPSKGGHRTHKPPSTKPGVAAQSKMPPAVRRWYERSARRTVKDVKMEFVKFRSYVPDHFTTKAFEQNSTKNRYKDVLCLDSSRVVLNDGREGDYIHASWVDGDNIRRQYICAQGPMNNTIEDFWRMIWQEKIELVVQLCDFVEKDQEKTAEYFPRVCGRPKIYDNFRISCTDVRNEYLAGGHKVAVTRLGVQCAKETRQVQHYLFSEWPDQGVPQDSRAVLKLSKIIGEAKPPVLVHCSGGIGRTATLVLVDKMRAAFINGRAPDIRQLVMKARNQRIHSIQTDAQYLLVHKACVQFIQLRWDLEESAAFKEFEQEYDKYASVFK